MPFAKNKPRPVNAGRKKGSRNKKTIVKQAIGIDNWTELSGFIEGAGIKRYVQEMNKMTGKDFTTAFSSLAEFVKPKLSRAEHTSKVENINYNVDLNKSEIDEITKAFKNDY